MTPKDQVISLELSKQLSELGLKQHSLFYWEWVNDNCYGVRYFPFCVTPRNAGEFLHFSAFTSSELMEMLPDRIILPDRAPFDCFRFNLSRSNIVDDNMQICPTFIVNYVCDTFEISRVIPRQLFRNIWAKSLPDTLAKTLIYIKEHKLDQPYIIPVNISAHKE